MFRFLKTKGDRDSFATDFFIGKRIKNIQFTSLDYQHTRENIEGEAFRKKERTIGKRAYGIHWGNIAHMFPMDQCAQLDVPIIMEFTDGWCLCFEMNELANEFLYYYCKSKDKPKPDSDCNVDGNVLFASVLNHVITGVEYFDYREDLVDINPEETRIPGVAFLLEDGSRLEVEGDFDYFWVSHLDKNREILTIPFKELKKGICNWEDKQKAKKK